MLPCDDEERNSLEAVICKVSFLVEWKKFLIKRVSLNGAPVRQESTVGVNS